MSDTLLSILAGVFTAVVTTAVSWGIMQGKMEALKADNDELRERQQYFEENYVGIKQFESVIKPMQDALREVQRDIKKILMMLSRNEPARPHN